MNIDYPPLSNLHRLWADRHKALMQSVLLLPESATTDKLRQVADAYAQCAEELKNPPTELFVALGYDMTPAY
jgi:hypothetical protein